MRMLRTLAAGLAAIAVLAIARTPADGAAAQFQGRWTIAYCHYPTNGCDEGFICIDAVKSPGLVVGMPVGGTFTGHFAQLAEWSLTGRWVQNGSLVQLFARYDSKPFFLSVAGTLGRNLVTGTVIDSHDDLKSQIYVGTVQGTRIAKCPTPYPGASARRR